MNPKKITLFVWYLALSYLVTGQKIPQIGIEAGVTFAQSADKNNRTEYYSEFVTTGASSQLSFVTNPTPGIMFGTTSTWKFLNKLSLSSGLQFKNVNTIYHITGLITSDIIRWNINEWVKEKLYKLSIPVTLGYTFNTGRIKPSIYFGTSFNYYLNGRINQKTSNTYYSFYDSQTTNDTFNETINPFERSGEYFKSARKFVNQLIIRLSTAVGKNLSVNFGYNIGLNNSCKNTYMSRGNYSTSYSYKYTRIANSDLTVSISYNIFNPKSSDKLNSEEKE
jgi:hypothetical protein